MEKSKLMMSLFIVFIMVLSTAGFIINQDDAGEQAVEYNGVVLKINEKGVYAETDFGKIHFDFLPENTEDIELNPLVVSRIKNTKMAYLTSEHNSTLSQAVGYAEYEIVNALVKRGVYLEAGFITETGKAKKITCSDATDFIPVLFFREGEAGIDVQGNCVMLSADSETGFLRIKDRLLYSVFGIME